MQVKFNFYEKVRLAWRVFYKMMPFKNIGIFLSYGAPFYILYAIDPTLPLGHLAKTSPVAIHLLMLLLFNVLSHALFYMLLYKLTWEASLKDIVYREFAEEKEKMSEEIKKNVDKELLVK